MPFYDAKRLKPLSRNRFVNLAGRCYVLAMTSIQDLISLRQGENLKLHQAINPQFAKVLKTIGFDQVYAKAAGPRLWDSDGHEYLDFLSGYGVYGIGRNHPRLKKTLHEFIDTDWTNLVQMEAPLLSGLLAEKLLQLFGHGIRDTVYFTNSGTESNESAIKFVRAATGRSKILHLTKAFHGLSTGSLSVNGNEEFRKGFGELLPADAVALDDLDGLEKKISSREYAAFIFEPLQGKGVFVPQKSFLQQAMEICRKYGTLTIADEVQTGLGRTGKWLACEHFGIEPDIVTISKALSGGMVPVGAVIYKREIYERVFSSMDRCVVHSSTFGQNNLAMVCGLTTLDIIHEEGLIDRSARLGEIFLKKLRDLQKKHGWILAVRGMGLMIGIEFGKPEGFKQKLAWNLVHKLDKGLFGELIVMPLLSKHRIITQVSGHHQDILKILPPYIIDESHIDKFIGALDLVLEDCDRVTGPIFSMGKNLAKHALTGT